MRHKLKNVLVSLTRKKIKLFYLFYYFTYIYIYIYIYIIYIYIYLFISISTKWKMFHQWCYFYEEEKKFNNLYHLFQKVKNTSHINLKLCKLSKTVGISEKWKKRYFLVIFYVNIFDVIPTKWKKQK